MKKGDEASLSIILAGRALLVKMLITLETHGIFGSNSVHLCILTFQNCSSFCCENRKYSFVVLLCCPFSDVHTEMHIWLMARLIKALIY